MSWMPMHKEDPCPDGQPFATPPEGTHSPQESSRYETDATSLNDSPVDVNGGDDEDGE